MTTDRDTTSSEQASRRAHKGPAGRGLACAVLAAAVLEVVAPVITIAGAGSSPGDGAGPDLAITPVGWAFSIWGAIYCLAIVQATAVLATRADAVSRRLQTDLLVLYIGGAVWILCAGLDSSLATAAALVVMFAAAIDAVLTVTRDTVTPSWLAVLTRVTAGLYAGWVTVALFLNLSTALVDADVVEADVVGWQLVVLALAAVTVLSVLAATRANLAYAGAGAWGMVGIAATGAADGNRDVVAVAIAGVVAVLIAVVVVSVRRAAHRRQGDAP